MALSLKFGNAFQKAMLLLKDFEIIKINHFVSMCKCINLSFLTTGALLMRKSGELSNF